MFFYNRGSVGNYEYCSSLSFLSLQHDPRPSNHMKEHINLFCNQSQEIFSKAMEAKRAFIMDQNLREDPIGNYATTAPRSEFIPRSQNPEIRLEHYSAGRYAPSPGRYRSSQRDRPAVR